MLTISIPNEALQSASFPVRVCLDGETLKSVDFTKYKWVYVLLSAVASRDLWREKSRGTRYFFPLNNLIQYVAPKCPGEHLVSAWLVGVKGEEDLESLSRLFTKKDTYGELYNGNLFDSRGIPIEIDEDSAISGGEYSYLYATVPDGCFAKEPPAWLKSWATLWWDTTVQDQCDFRRRLIFALTFQPVFMAFFILLKLLALIITLALGFWWLNWSEFFDTMTGLNIDLWLLSNARDNVFRKIFRHFVPEKEPEPLTVALERANRFSVASCEFSSEPATNLVSGDKRIYLRLMDLKQKVCKPFSR